LQLRTRLAVVAGGGLGALSRAARRGSGSVIGGHAILAIDPLALERLSAGRQVALVSGTNGKTTTTKLLASAIGAGGQRPVVTNILGANLPAGLAAALAAGEPGATAVLEVDEAWLPKVAASMRPAVLVLLNLSRDQLDRNNEVRHVSQRWRIACEQAPPGAVVVANADDPLVVWAASTAERVTWVGAGLRWNSDATGCPQCGGPIVFEADGGWACSSCGFSRPVPEISLGQDDGRPCVVLASGTRHAMTINLPGRCNQSNAVMASAAVLGLGGDITAALQAMAGVREVAGRYATIEVDGVHARFLLAKNPAGWAEVFDMLSPAPTPVVIAINARTADGHDPSWLWDVPFELLRGRPVTATGERGLDLAVRLHYGEVDHTVEPSASEALRKIAAGAGQGAHGPRQVDVVANYTAFHQALAALRKGVAGTNPGTPGASHAAESVSAP
jgi:UDP-N-acetylmuramyl tripeptide synthase